MAWSEDKGKAKIVSDSKGGSHYILSGSPTGASGKLSGRRNRTYK